MQILSKQEQSILSRYLNDNLTPCNLGILICLYTGLRIGEICALKWEDICIAEHYLDVHKTMQRVKIMDGHERHIVLIGDNHSEILLVYRIQFLLCKHTSCPLPLKIQVKGFFQDSLYILRRHISKIPVIDLRRKFHAHRLLYL